MPGDTAVGTLSRNSSTVFTMLLVMCSGERKGKALVSLIASGFGLL